MKTFTRQAPQRTIAPMPGMRLHLFFAGLVLLGALVFLPPLGDLSKVVFQNETYSHIVLIPLVSLALIGSKRARIFCGVSGDPFVGIGLCAGGLFLYGIAIAFKEHLNRQAFRPQDVPNDYLTLCMAGAVAWVIGSFITIYGVQAYRKARFALLFLLFSIPIPMFLMDGIVALLQHASAAAADIAFKLSGVSYYRSGLVFEFSNLAVHVAEQCSGIRSSLSLLIASILMGYLFLNSVSGRLILAVAVFPITVAKNALRITLITLLANQVSHEFLSNHWLHASGGIPFFAIALSLLVPLVWVLRKNEKRIMMTS